MQTYIQLGLIATGLVLGYDAGKDFAEKLRFMNNDNSKGSQMVADSDLYKKISQMPVLPEGQWKIAKNATDIITETNIEGAALFSYIDCNHVIVTGAQFKSIIESSLHALNTNNLLAKFNDRSNKPTWNDDYELEKYLTSFIKKIE